MRSEVRLDRVEVCGHHAHLECHARLGIEAVVRLVEHPRPAERAAADHHRRAAGLGHHAARLVDRGHVTVARHGNVHRLDHLTDHVPGRAATELLRTRARMHGDRIDADFLSHQRDLDGVRLEVVPAATDLDRERHLELATQRAEHAAGRNDIAHKRGALASAHDLRHRTAHVDVDDVRARLEQPVRRRDQGLCGTPEQLHRHHTEAQRRLVAHHPLGRGRCHG